MSQNSIILSHHKTFKPNSHISICNPSEAEDKLFISKSIRFDGGSEPYCAFIIGVEEGLEEKGIIPGQIHGNPFEYASELAKYRSY